MSKTVFTKVDYDLGTLIKNIAVPVNVFETRVI